MKLVKEKLYESIEHPHYLNYGLSIEFNFQHKQYEIIKTYQEDIFYGMFSYPTTRSKKVAIIHDDKKLIEANWILDYSDKNIIQNYAKLINYKFIQSDIYI